MNDIEESSRSWNKRGALEEIETLKAYRSTAWDEHTHSFRWLMASLLAVNGGACLAVIDKLDRSSANGLIAGGCFVAGIMAALLVAVLGQKSVQKSFGPLNKLIGYWMTVADDGVRDEEIEKEFSRDLENSVKIARASAIAGWISAIAFVAGVVSVGTGLVTENSHSPSMSEASAETVEMPADESRLPSEDEMDQSGGKQAVEKMQ